MKFDIKVIEK